MRKILAQDTLLAMPPSAANSKNALYLSWKLSSADSDEVGRARRRLCSGQARRLYQLRSWVIVAGEVRALLSPTATLERVVNAIWDNGVQPLATRWVPTREFAGMVRDIESAPVLLGLTSRPEQWPLSSAAAG